MQRNIYGNYTESRKLQTVLHSELAEFGAPDPMDLSVCRTCDDQPEALIRPNGSDAASSHSQPGQHGEKTGKGHYEEDQDNLPKWVLDALGKGKGKGQARTCYNCGEGDHMARDCKNAFNAAAWRPPKGDGKGGQPWNPKSGGFKGKGKGKGKGGKGSAHSLEEAYWQWPEEEYRSLGNSL